MGAALLAAYLVLWWVIASAASRRHGAAFFALGLALLALASWAYRRGRRVWLYRLGYASLLAATTALLLEAALHVKPSLLGGRVANFAYSGYHPYRGGIYALDPEIGPLMRPSVRRWMYWNGHWWWHESNAQGWRGPALDHADVVFLGDSMIYGHGVPAGDSVPARFARATGLATANIGQQGTCAPQQLELFRRRGVPLRPRVVFLCAHPSDPEDVARMYAPAEQEAYLQRPGYHARVLPEYGPPRRWDPLWLWARHAELPLWSGGILGSLVRTMRERRAQEFTAARDPFIPTAAERDEVLPALRADAPAAERRAWLVHRRAVEELRGLCAGAGARLVLFDLGYPRTFSAATEALAGEMGIEYSPAGRVALGRSLAGERVYLANDGHWSGGGAAAVAGELARTGAVRAIMRD